MGTLKRLVIHCTATPEGREVTSEEIRHWHTDPVCKGGRGWKQVGYTDMFHLDGTVERLVDNNEDSQVDSWEVTNGATGYNSTSRHIVYVGGCDKNLKAKDTRTDAQKKSMAQYVREFHRIFPSVEICGHRDLPGVNKSCPSFDVKEWIKQIIG